MGVTVNLIGPHGEGKSSVIKQYAKEEGMYYKEFRTGQAADAGDLVGLPKFMQNVEFDYEYTSFVLPDWFPRQKNTVVFFDEVNRGAKDILNGVFEAILDFSMKGIPFPEGCQVVTAMNPPTGDYSGTMDFDDLAWQDRFLHISFKPTWEEYKDYQTARYADSSFLAFFADNQTMIRTAVEEYPLTFVKPSPRSCETTFKLERLYDQGIIGNDLLLEMSIGLVGLETATALVSFKKTHIVSIKGSDVIDSYHLKKKDGVRSKVQNAIKADRKDMLAKMNKEINEELGKRTSLTDQQANNIISLASDLVDAPETQYTLLTYITQNEGKPTVTNCGGFETLAGGKGLSHSTELIKVVAKTQNARKQFSEESAKQKETAKA